MIPFPLMLLAGAGFILAASDGAPSIGIVGAKTTTPKKETMPAKLNIMSASSLGRKSGPLPAQALAAYNTTKYTRGGPNDIHQKGAWFRWAVYSDKWHKKHASIDFFSSPRGANRVRSNSKWTNLAWMARSPRKIYPYYKLGRGRVKWSKLEPLIGPKADWKTLTGGVADVLKEIPDIVASAGLIAGGVASGGQSAQADPQGQVKQVMDTVKDLLGSASGVIGKTKERTEAAAAIVEAVALQYKLELLAANPWIVRDGRVDIGKNYPQNPRTFEDLYRKPAPGEKRGRPLMFNPKRS